MRARAFIIALVVAVCAVAARLVTRDEVGDAAPRSEASGAPVSPRTGWAGARTLSSVSPAPADEAPRVELAFDDADASVPAPSGAEAGPLRADFDRWSSEAPDRARSRRVQAYVESMLATHDVHASRVDVACTSSLCRASLGFDAEADLHALARVPADRASIRVGAPSVTEDGVALVLYWDRDAAPQLR